MKTELLAELLELSEEVIRSRRDPYDSKEIDRRQAMMPQKSLDFPVKSGDLGELSEIVV